MKRVGRTPKPLTKADIEMIEEYLHTDKSLIEVATKYGISGEGLRYKVKKYCKEQKICYGEFEGEIFELPPRITVTFLLSEDGKHVLLEMQGDAVCGIMQEHTDRSIPNAQYAIEAVKRKTGIDMSFDPETKKDDFLSKENCLYWVLGGAVRGKYVELEIYTAKVHRDDITESDTMMWFNTETLDRMLFEKTLKGMDGIDVGLYIDMARWKLNFK